MRYLLHKHIPIVTALDTIWGSSGGTLGIMPFLSKAPLAAAKGRRVTNTTIGQQALILQCWDIPLKML